MTGRMEVLIEMTRLVNYFHIPGTTFLGINSMQHTIPHISVFVMQIMYLGSNVFLLILFFSSFLLSAYALNQFREFSNRSMTIELLQERIKTLKTKKPPNSDVSL
jgi:hypothetical protein